MHKLFFRSKSGLLLVFLLLGFHNLKSQEDCSRILEEAEILFEQGVIEDIPMLLSGCLDYGFSRSENERARKLIILAYLFDNNMPQAENHMKLFIRNNPEYTIKADDPAEFTQLFSSFTIMPAFSFGLLIGGSLTSAVMAEPFGLYNPGVDQGHFEASGPDIQIGATASWFMGNRMELNLEGVFTRNTFTYSNSQFGLAEFLKKETLERIEFPVSLSYDLPGTRWEPYFRAGVSFGIITGARAKYQHSHLNSDNGNPDPLITRETNIRDMRNTRIITGILGGGIKFKIPRGQIYMDLRYWYGFSQLSSGVNRWDQETVFRFYHADGNFHIDHLSFSFGYRYLLYKSRIN